MNAELSMSRSTSAVDFIGVWVKNVDYLVGIVHRNMATKSLCFFWSNCRNRWAGVVAQVK